jgi:hypothetical protein
VVRSQSTHLRLTVIVADHPADVATTEIIGVWLKPVGVGGGRLPRVLARLKSLLRTDWRFLAVLPLVLADKMWLNILRSGPIARVLSQPGGVR